MDEGIENRGLDKEQLAVMVRLSQDQSQKQIAEEMGRSLSWVQKTVRAIKDHYGVDSLPALITLFTEESPDYRFFDPDKEVRTEPYNMRSWSRQYMTYASLGLILILAAALAFGV